MQALYVVWFKYGYWYCADTKAMQTDCSKLKELLWPMRNRMPLLKAEGGAEYY